MKIIFFVYKFPVSSETFIINQIVYLLEQGYDIKIFSIYPGDMINRHQEVEEYDLLRKTFYLIPTESDNFFLKVLNRLFNVFKNIYREKVRESLNYHAYGQHAKNLFLPYIVSKNDEIETSDIIIAHFGPASVIANKLRKLGLLQGKLVTIFHGADISIKSLLEKYLNDYRQLFVEGEQFLPISNLWKNKLISLGCPSEKIKVIRMGIDPTQFKFNPVSKLHDPVRILSVARLIEKKGLDIAIDACSLLVKNGYNIIYEIVGHGPLLNVLQEKIKSLNLQDIVKLRGFKTQSEINSIFETSDIFLLPSITAKDGDMEGIPVALMEAMAKGIPIISTFHSGIPELIKNNISGWLVQENDPQMISEVVIHLIKDQSEIYDKLLNARNVVENEFSKSNSYNELINVLKNL